MDSRKLSYYQENKAYFQFYYKYKRYVLGIMRTKKLREEEKKEKVQRVKKEKRPYKIKEPTTFPLRIEKGNFTLSFD